MPPTTPVSLLDRLCEAPDAETWELLVDLYTPVLHAWLNRHALQPSDRDDLTQEVLGIVVKELPAFRHSGRTGAFRAWLRTITVHCLRRFWRAGRYRPRTPGGSDFEDYLRQLEDPGSAPSRLWDREHDQHLLRRLLEVLEGDFQPSTWQAFRRVVLEGQAADRVAVDLGLTVNAVLIAKCRVLQRLRQEARGLLD
jgi:RNA polymerase sigma-70 factor (ECF subfamily)